MKNEVCKQTATVGNANYLIYAKLVVKMDAIYSHFAVLVGQKRGDKFV